VIERIRDKFKKIGVEDVLKVTPSVPIRQLADGTGWLVITKNRILVKAKLNQ
jgi:hypothetical protein